MKKTPLIYSFSIRQYFWEYISEKRIHLCICFQLGNAFENIQVEKKSLMYSFSIRQCFWEYISEKRVFVFN